MLPASVSGTGRVAAAHLVEAGLRGLGLRFEFKHRMNIRIDYGFGKGTSGLVVQFAEAF